METNNPDAVETALRNELSIKYNNDEYVFKLPSIKDRMKIVATAARLRKDVDPEGTGIQLGYDPAAVMLTDRLATFMILLKSTSATWVYTTDEKGRAIMRPEAWSDDVPILEVVDQFNDELAKFRANGNQSPESTR